MTDDSQRARSALKDFSSELKLEKSITLIENVLERLEAGSFSIAVVGDFKRGKSTLINALLGKEILPSDIIPTTATLNRVTYGLQPGVQIVFKDGRNEADRKQIFVFTVVVNCDRHK